MRDRYVVDTNVLIAASAADPVGQRDIDATPADPALRRQVWDWLSAFEQTTTRMILDSTGKIYDEYCGNLDFGDYGRAVVIHKWSTGAVDNVAVDYDADGHGILPDALNPVVHDLSDRKMVASALLAHVQFGEGCIAFAGDTDWHDWETDLQGHNVLLEPIIEEWSRQKHAEKQAR